MAEGRTPWWLWPSLLSLEAPLVAVAWLYMFARAWGVTYLPAGVYFGLGLAVWLIYVVDRWIDLRMRDAGDPALGRRHQFHARHWRWFGIAVVAVLGVLVWVVFGVLPMEFFLTYAIPGGLMVVGFFAMVLLGPGGGRIPYLRNILAGFAFGYGTAMMAHLFVPALGAGDMIWSREMLSFAVLCVLNISAIHLWEHSRHSDDPEVKAADEMALTLPLTLLAGFALVFAWFDNPSMFRGTPGSVESPTRPFFYAILISAALLQVINRTRRRFSLDQLRALADGAMLVPLPLFVVLAGA